MESEMQADKRRDIAEWLSPPDYSARQIETFAQRLPEAKHDFLRNEEFQQWTETIGSTIFCLGIPGAGKSMTTACVVDHLLGQSREDPSIAVAYLYFDYKRSSQRLDDILSCILRQIVQGQDSVSDPVHKMYNNRKKSATRPRTAELLACLQSSIATCSRCYLVLDGLDEFRAAPGISLDILLADIFRLQQSHKINLMATSRPIAEISDHFRHCIRCEIEASQIEIEAYIRRRMHEMPIVVQQQPDAQTDIIGRVAEAAAGM